MVGVVLLEYLSFSSGLKEVKQPKKKKKKRIAFVKTHKVTQENKTP